MKSQRQLHMADSLIWLIWLMWFHVFASTSMQAQTDVTNATYRPRTKACGCLLLLQDMRLQGAVRLHKTSKIEIGMRGPSRSNAYQTCLEQSQFAGNWASSKRESTSKTNSWCKTPAEGLRG